MNIPTSFQRILCTALVSLSASTLALGQSALSTKVGLGYTALGYAAEHNGVMGVEVLNGPQMDFDVSLGLGNTFSVGVDADLTIVESGVRVDGLTEFDLLEINDILNDSSAQDINGAIFAGAAMVGVHFGDFKPSVGIGWLQAEVSDADQIAIRDFSCAIFVAKPIEYKFADFMSVAAEYERSIGGCDVEFEAASFAARIAF